MVKRLIVVIWFGCLFGCQSTVVPMQTTLKVATFNVSMEATNYLGRQMVKGGPNVLKTRLQSGEHQQIKNIAEILQRTRPDIVLLNEFDYIESPKQGVKAFIDNYLAKSQNGAQAIDYPYFYYSTVNTGQPTDFDLDNDGKAEHFKADAQGFGYFPGHYGMAILSKYPIQQAAVRTFQYFLWSDMPGAIQPIDPATNQSWYNKQEWAALRLSSKSHWDVPVLVDGKVLHLLASHPTPPVFDGPDNHNGARNHDEVRFWRDYITPDHNDYIYDDNQRKGGLAADSLFVVIGDQNASPDEGEATEGIVALLNSAKVNASFAPQSEGGRLNKPDSPNSQDHTAIWGARADYVLPSKAITVIDGGIFWPLANDPLFRLIADREASSDHRLVWLEIKM
jgi:hypothetical protein